jgi:glycosyltransferase involved in cell wall biosynthesis
LVFLEIIERLKEFGFKGKIFGDGPLKQQIVHEITARKLPINLFPFTSNIEAEIEDSNYCIFPAQSESFGISVLEVLRSGKIPIVFKDGGGLVEILKPIAKGRLIVNNVEQCVQLLLELNNETDLSVIQAELKDRLSDFFVSNIVQQYITFYNELIKNT